jgi:formate C-acetyltransferase
VRIELDCALAGDPKVADVIEAMLPAHFEEGGTLANINIVEAERVLAAHENPEAYPDLIVRVTGFTAYFAALSPEFRRQVVDRLLIAR